MTLSVVSLLVHLHFAGVFFQNILLKICMLYLKKVFKKLLQIVKNHLEMKKMKFRKDPHWLTPGIVARNFMVPS